MGIPFLYYFPSDTSLIRDSYNVIVDAIFGSSFKPPVKPEFAAILSQISRCGLPIASIDVPSGESVHVTYQLIYVYSAFVYITFPHFPHVEPTQETSITDIQNVDYLDHHKANSVSRVELVQGCTSVPSPI